MNFRKTQVFFFLVLCIAALQTILAANTKSPHPKVPQAKMLRAHMSEGAQPRFQDLPLLYAMGLQRQ
ncbi:hypothetical protein HNY73_015758 [Argiope bruennichi]|uniref:Uncharacterized protein n=1 Tax=Argiope bruennichi TaxID=94029 RepID=A0A8T0EHV1_ARGBR|nr:hypothetical protein HNY73_015758 [Argiope bruennichi]